MRYSIEHRDRIYVKGCRFLSFAKNISNKYHKKLLESAKKSKNCLEKSNSKNSRTAWLFSW